MLVRVYPTILLRRYLDWPTIQFSAFGPAPLGHIALLNAPAFASRIETLSCSAKDDCEFAQPRLPELPRRTNSERKRLRICLEKYLPCDVAAINSSYTVTGQSKNR